MPTSTLRAGVTRSLGSVSNAGLSIGRKESPHTQKERENMRILTERLRVGLVERLQGHGGCRVHITHMPMPNNLNSHKLAWDFYDVLLQSGWPVDEPCPVDLLSSDEVQVGVVDCSSPPQCGQSLQDALVAVGVGTPGHLVRGQGASLDRCCLMVGNIGEPRSVES
jgi:hypothetical protein